VTRWIAIGAIVAAVWLAKFPDVASAQADMVERYFGGCGIADE
jgi:hypothetical protein